MGAGCSVGSVDVIENRERMDLYYGVKGLRRLRDERLKLEKKVCDNVCL